MAPLRIWTLAVLVVLATAAIGTTAASAALPLYGVQGIRTDPGTNYQQIGSRLNSAQRLHVALVRVEVTWYELEPITPGVYDPATLAAIDHVVNGAAMRGIRVVMVVDGTPCWASSAPASSRNGCKGPTPNTFDVTRYPPSDPQTYVPVSTFLAARYGSELTAFEVWNEPDQINQKYWAGPNKIARYVALAKAVYGPLKQAVPGLQVLAGSFVGTNGVWLQQLYNAGIKGNYDGLAVHFYDLPLYALITTRAVQIKNGDTRPMWLTEFGWTSCYKPGGPAIQIDQRCVTAGGQAQNLIDTMRAIQKVSWVRAAIVYQIQDDRTGYNFGLLTAAGQLKPAFTAVGKIIAAVRLAIQRPIAHLRRSSGHLIASGTASGTDLYTIKVYKGTGKNRQLRMTATVRTSALNTWRLSFPKQLGTRKISLTITGGWTGHASATTH